MTPQSNLMILAGRAAMALLFIISGFGKFTAAAATKAYFAKIGVPSPDIAYIVAVGVELGVGTLFLLGIKTRWMAAILAVFTVATAMLGHANTADMVERTNFLKNLAIAGGFLAFSVLGGGAYSLDGQLARPSRAKAQA